ncbi:pantoate--beta-alanine ligase [bacterium]|nr:pantoate--beta-alanine ligase [bacterium]
MRLLRTRAELHGFRTGRATDRPLVLVPTMGALHAGHLALVEQASREGEVVVSVFVNPTQFAPGEDYDAYPRDLDRDLQALAPLAPSAVFAPSRAEMYPREISVSVVPGPAADGLCGASRPGHFSGVLTVVLKLLNLVGPDVAVFGRKDAQQCLVIGEMVRDLDVPVRLIDHPTVREPDGLAMSSRNAYLSQEARTRAQALYRALATARRRLEDGERDTAVLVEAMRAELAPVDAIEYVEVRRVPDLAVPARTEGRLLLALAARVEPARLIDNLVLEVSDAGVRDASLFEQGDAAS